MQNCFGQKAPTLSKEQKRSDDMKTKADRFNEFVFDDRKRKIVMARKSLAADPENAAGWVGAMIGEALPYLAASVAGSFPAAVLLVGLVESQG